MPSYDKKFFEAMTYSAIKSSDIIVPLLFETIQPQSVLDVGCGTGGWLKAFKDLGVPTTIGIDGEYVNRDHLLIDATDFHAMDLQAPISLGRNFDVVVSLEVAEHLPEAAAIGFVKFLTEHSSVVVFSAAVPNQGGTDHLNEQWQSYWANLFASFGYKAYDWIRPRIWANQEVSFWYKQNIVMYVSTGCDLGHLQHFPEAKPVNLDVVHPELFNQYANFDISLKKLIRATSQKSWEKFKKLLVGMPISQQL